MVSESSMNSEGILAMQHLRGPAIEYQNIRVLCPYGKEIIRSMEVGIRSPRREDSCANISNDVPPGGLPGQCA